MEIVYVGHPPTKLACQKGTLFYTTWDTHLTHVFRQELKGSPDLTTYRCVKYHQFRLAIVRYVFIFKERNVNLLRIPFGFTFFAKRKHVKGKYRQSRLVTGFFNLTNWHPFYYLWWKRNTKDKEVCFICYSHCSH